jgi:hypothetical protein
MLSRLFPESLTNIYLGSWLALWLFLPVLIVKTLMGANFSGLNPFIDAAEILRTVDGVPLDSFSQAAAASVVESAAAWGMALLSLCLFAWIIVVRYRAGLPLAILMLLIEQIGRTGVGLIASITAFVVETAPLTLGAIINMTMSGLLLIAFLLSLPRVRRTDAIRATLSLSKRGAWRR